VFALLKSWLTFLLPAALPRKIASVLYRDIKDPLEQPAAAVAQRDGTTLDRALHHACQGGHLQLVRVLLDSGTP
jgi:hypothetical protein